jgi:arsenate reductase-like glutaredoxin family protein
MINNQPNEITLIFHSDKEEDKKTRAYVETLEDYAIKTLDLKRENLTATQLTEIADKLGIQVGALVDEQYSDRVKIESVKGLRDQDTLKLLANNPILLATPIVIIGEHAYQFDSSYDLIHETAAIRGLRGSSAANVEEKNDS